VISDRNRESNPLPPRLILRNESLSKSFGASVFAPSPNYAIEYKKCDTYSVIFPISLVIFGITGWIASFGLTLERLKVAANPDATTACDISPFLSCKSVMLSEQAALFGFPNPLIGIAAFMAPIVVGMAILSGAKFKSWFWQLFLLGNLLGMAFVIWLFTQAAYSIGALCIYCMVAWTAMIPIFWAVFGYAAKEGHLFISWMRAGETIFSWAWVLTLITYVSLALLILIQFWDYWPTLF
jgi:uncharacterized membrane protein